MLSTHRPSTLPAGTNEPEPLLLTALEMGAMPPQLADQLQAWLVPHRAAQARLPWFEQRPVPKRSTLEDLGRELLRVVADQAPLDYFKAWLSAYDGRATVHLGDDHPLKHPIDLVATAIASHRLDVLNAVLDCPDFCPTENVRLLAPTAAKPPPAQVELFARHGKALFNGGLAGPILVSTQDHGLALIQVAVSIATSPAVEVNDPLRPWALHHSEAMGKLQTEGQTNHKVGWRGMQMLHEVNHGIAGPIIRGRQHINVVGMAGLMGWVEGMQALLDHGVNPYAHHTEASGTAQFLSPLIVTAASNEKEIVATLLRHPSMNLKHRYGYTKAEYERLGNRPDVRKSLWHDIEDGTHGGLDLRLLLENVDVMQDPNVATTLLEAYDRLASRDQRYVSEGLNTVLSSAAKTLWEGMVLRHTLVNKTLPAERPRSRL